MIVLVITHLHTGYHFKIKDVIPKDTPRDGFRRKSAGYTIQMCLRYFHKEMDTIIRDNRILREYVMEKRIHIHTVLIRLSSSKGIGGTVIRLRISVWMVFTEMKIKVWS